MSARRQLRRQCNEWERKFLLTNLPIFQKGTHHHKLLVTVWKRNFSAPWKFLSSQLLTWLPRGNSSHLSQLETNKIRIKETRPRKAYDLTLRESVEMTQEHCQVISVEPNRKVTASDQFMREGNPSGRYSTTDTPNSNFDRIQRVRTSSLCIHIEAFGS